MKPVYSTVYVRSRGFLGGVATVHVGEFVIGQVFNGSRSTHVCSMTVTLV